MKNLKLRILLLILILVVAFMSCHITDFSDDVNSTNFSASDSFSYDIAVKKQSRVVINAINGQIEIVGRQNISTVKIWGERIVKSETEDDAAEHLKKLEVHVSDSNDGIFIQTEQPSNSNGRNYLVNYNLIIPVDWNVSIDHVNGTIKIDSLNGDISIDLVNGDIQLQEVNGNVDVQLTNGKIYSKQTLPEQGMCKMTAVNAQIQLYIPENTSANFAAGVTNGTVSVTNLNVQNLQSAHNFVNGVLGSGQGTIRLEAVNGTISASGY